MKRDGGRRRVSAEEGQATIEFAIIIPLLLLLVVGIFEFGKAFNYWIDLNHLANEGARWAAVEQVPNITPDPDHPSPDDLKTYLIDQAGSRELQAAIAPDGGPDNSHVTVCYIPGPDSPDTSRPEIGDAVTVSIEAPYSFPLVSGLMNLAGSLFGAGGSVGDVTLKGSATERLEQLPPPNASGQWQNCAEHTQPPLAPTIDNPKPPNPEPTPPPDPQFFFSDTQAGVSFECSIDNGPYKSCTSPVVFDGTNYPILAAGSASHTFKVLARDSLGQISAPAIFTWVIS